MSGDTRAETCSITTEDNETEISEFLNMVLGPKQMDDYHTLMIITIFYATVLITGILGNEATTAIPAQPGSGDPESTEKIDTRAAREQADETPTRRGGGVSAADLLRREGRL